MADLVTGAGGKRTRQGRSLRNPAERAPGAAYARMDASSGPQGWSRGAAPTGPAGPAPRPSAGRRPASPGRPAGRRTGRSAGAVRRTGGVLDADRSDCPWETDS
ncbi:hypothetical protein GCM10010261_44370 [Streptomyces pilosus]|uniref:Uncharacterized protein n=1 Tax=Streptomyces pilosus TaxID=28893 RepID=A0A918EYI3_9ACTN|nr:hypothetical protein GCM10010280_42800 [Streptomyces pilosus]GGV58078.1 hypothetical protein GCM10010261_44370 [Streptomyces pilosus]